MIVSVCFTNFGPYHLARLRAWRRGSTQRGDRLIAYEVAGTERTYPWTRSRRDEPFEWITLFPDRVLETIEADACRWAMLEALEHDRPDVLGIVGYARPESIAAARWAARAAGPTILMSESQAIDKPRVWWKELIKRAAHPAVRRGRRRRPGTRGLPGPARHAAIPHRDGLQRR